MLYIQLYFLAWNVSSSLKSGWAIEIIFLTLVLIESSAIFTTPNSVTRYSARSLKLLQWSLQAEWGGVLI